MSIFGLLLAPTLLFLPGHNPTAEVQAAQQVRIEQRVIIRVTPRSGATRASTFTGTNPPASIRIIEQPLQSCISVTDIAGVSGERGNRLRLYMHNRQLLTLQFGKTCQTDAFYSGFYLEQNDDGMLCPARDVLHSRSGVRCTVGRINRLVAEPAK